jgi:hypothetical protein
LSPRLCPQRFICCNFCENFREMKCIFSIRNPFLNIYLLPHLKLMWQMATWLKNGALNQWSAVISVATFV